jgi:hypothetical protein
MRRAWLLWTVIAVEYVALAIPTVAYLTWARSRIPTVEQCMDSCYLDAPLVSLATVFAAVLLGVGVLVAYLLAALDWRRQRRGQRRTFPTGPAATATIMSAIGFGIGMAAATLSSAVLIVAALA